MPSQEVEHYPCGFRRGIAEEAMPLVFQTDQFSIWYPGNYNLRVVGRYQPVSNASYIESRHLDLRQPLVGIMARDCLCLTGKSMNRCAIFRSDIPTFSWTASGCY